jgi:hypothetical protein
MLKFASDHEWILLDDDCATVGITDYAQEQLRDLVFVQLPNPGTNLQAGGVAANVIVDRNDLAIDRRIDLGCSLHRLDDCRHRFMSAIKAPRYIATVFGGGHLEPE